MILWFVSLDDCAILSGENRLCLTDGPQPGPSALTWDREGNVNVSTGTAAVAIDRSRLRWPLSPEPHLDLRPPTT